MSRFFVALSIFCVVNYFYTYSIDYEYYAKQYRQSKLGNKNASNNSTTDEKSFSSLQKISMELTSFDVNIDEDSYILGTGDGFKIYLWGNINSEVEAIIDQEGNLVIPSVGVVHIRNLSLREGREKIKAKVQNSYKKVKITIVLNEIRKFKVYALGEVSSPGFYEVNGASRVSDLIEIAGGFNSDSTDNYTQLRGIIIDNEHYPRQFADLSLFYHNNLTDKNPYLREGDHIFVPSSGELIRISGSVNYPGNYTYMYNDSLITLLNVAGGLLRNADSSKIIVCRFMDNFDSLASFELSFHDSSVFNFPIFKDDRILVCNIPSYRIHRQVKIMGEVNNPGVYPIQKDKTRLIEVVAMAGGLSEDAYLKSSKIVRKRITKFDDREYERLKLMPLENLTPLERSYLKTKQVEENGRISVDFEELYNKGRDLYNIILRDDDEIIIARGYLSLKVSGAVISPGLVSYKEGANFEYYINRAGGYTNEAQKRLITIIKGGSGMWLKPYEVDKLEAGDAIWVPEKPYIDKLKVTKDILLIVSSVATVIMSGLTIYSTVKN